MTPRFGAWETAWMVVASTHEADQQRKRQRMWQVEI